MDFRIRPYRTADDEQAVVDLSLRAWAPVFDSMLRVLGEEIFVRLHTADWRQYQASGVRETLAAPGMQAWVAEAGGRVVGFATATVEDPARQLGEVTMLAVDPSSQDHGLGTALTDHATAWLREAGMRVAMIGTGGDPGHAPARRVYDKAEYTPMPLVRYFKAI